MKGSAILLVTCPQQKGLVSRLSTFVARNNGNILQSDQHTDFEASLFLSRIEWELDGFALAPEEIAAAFTPLAAEIQAEWQLLFSDTETRTAIMVTRQDHCLLDLLWRAQTGELRTKIPLIIGNRPDLAQLAQKYDTEFEYVPFEDSSVEEVESRQLDLFANYGIGLVVLAKYMRVLSADFLSKAPPVINIHHSFLPAFRGGSPYHQAHRRGVKIIGATAHYVTPELDEGPIIDQQVAVVSHRDNVQDLIRRGRDVERMAISRAVRLHLEGKILVYGNRTVVFD